MIKKIIKYPISILVLTIILFITIIDISNKDKNFSNFENRSLAQRPVFYFDDFLKGRFSKDYERYINDQFVFRDTWIDLKSRSEYLLGKIENNNIIYGKDNFLFEKYEKVDEENLAKNIDSVLGFIRKIPNNKVNFMIIPSSYTIYKDYLPYGINLVDQEFYINDIYNYLNNYNNIKTISLIDMFKENKDKYIYYKTDHHWTSFGSYLAYSEFVKNNNLSLVDINNLNKHEVNNFYGTYFSKSKNFNAESDLITYYDVPNLSVSIDGVPVDNINDNSKWSSSDKYSAFLRGNNGLTIIQNNDISNNNKILVLKDSFGNSFIQYLVNNYKEVYVVDLRGFIGSFNEFFKSNNFDDVLIMYNFINLADDVNISKIKY
ncbi:MULTISPECIES: DHHW family protein [Clostridium]|jgi:DHHW protein|uniref:DHHW family protein n=3 Tax=Clostridium tertium TaxID=1559 RepID=A0A9X3XQ76_9CLOT|nr:MULTISPECIES: DHHW family protein [Clostridium]MDB1944952.1 DHHW family protein [Clostridium tertium]MDB1952602.1 DHHW family protein [Clostridium tertium]MDC4241684.1 DHHW family protein [Clostridium tertium]MDU3524586.1 DHHW family protein [Clostridium sp.]MDY4605746.1 DHHW family protein [Clostridium tertium]